MCTLATACSQIPWDADPGPAGNENALLAPAPAVSSPAAQPEPAVVSATAGPTFTAVPVAPPAKPEETKDLEPPHAIDLARPADDLWDRIRSGFAIPDLESPLVGVRERWYASQPEYLKRMIERSKLDLYYIVEAVEKRGMPP